MTEAQQDLSRFEITCSEKQAIAAAAQRRCEGAMWQESPLPWAFEPRLEPPDRKS